MYYKIYGVMSKNGFHTELFQANTEGKALSALNALDEKLYPFFAITEHRASGSSALSISIGRTSERKPISISSLVEYKPNPMLTPDLAEKLFTRLGESA